VFNIVLRFGVIKQEWYTAQPEIQFPCTSLNNQHTEKCSKRTVN